MFPIAVNLTYFLSFSSAVEFYIVDLCGLVAASGMAGLQRLQVGALTEALTKGTRVLK